MKDVLKRWQDANKVAKTEVLGDARTFPGRQMLRQDAIRSLPPLRLELDAAFRKVGFPVFIDGDNAKSLARNISDVAEVLVVDWSDMTKSMCHNIRVAGGVGTVEFSVNMFATLIREVRQWYAEAGVSQLPAINYDGPEYFADDNAFYGIVNSYLFKYVGSNLIAALIEKEAIDRLADHDFSSTIVPVLIIGIPKAFRVELTKHLYQGASSTIEAAGAVNDETVAAVLKTIKKAMKTNPNHNRNQTEP